MLPPKRPPRVIVTPGGRRRYLELLARHLEAQRGSFDTWQIWLNTTNADDLAYMRGLALAHPDWIVVRELTVGHNSNMSIHSFFPGAAERGTTYLRLDDDIVWLEAGFVEAMMAFREANRKPFLVYGSIVNNAVISHMFQRSGVVDGSHGRADYECMSAVGWNNGPFARMLHHNFICDVEAGDIERWRLPPWTLYDFERVSINCISWLGDDFAQFGGVVGSDEELWLSVQKPTELGRPNMIAGGAGHFKCAHFAFYPQRDVMDASGLLERYAALVP